MPRIAISSLVQETGELTGRRVTILGATYQSSVKETAFSGVFALWDELTGIGAAPRVIDPHNSSDELAQLGLDHCETPLTQEILIVHTDHPVFRDLTKPDFPKVSVIFDGRGIIDPINWPETTIMVLGSGKKLN